MDSLDQETSQLMKLDSKHRLVTCSQAGRQDWTRPSGRAYLAPLMNHADCLAARSLATAALNHR